MLAGDLRRDDLGLSSLDHDRLADGLQAVFHCAANVKHFGHYWEFHADNVAATRRLLKLAAHRAANPADFHLGVDSIGVRQGPRRRFPAVHGIRRGAADLDENYYIRSKQEAERLVVAAAAESRQCLHSSRRQSGVCCRRRAAAIEYQGKRLLPAACRLHPVGSRARRFSSLAVPCGCSGARTRAAGRRGRSDQRNSSSGECQKGFAGRLRQLRGTEFSACGFDAFPGAAGSRRGRTRHDCGSGRNAGKLRSVSRRVAAGSSAPSGDRFRANPNAVGAAGTGLAVTSAGRPDGNAARGGSAFLLAHRGKRNGPNASHYSNSRTSIRRTPNPRTRSLNNGYAHVSNRRR